MVIDRSYLIAITALFVCSIGASEHPIRLRRGGSSSEIGGNRERTTHLWGVDEKSLRKTLNRRQVRPQRVSRLGKDFSKTSPRHASQHADDVMLMSIASRES
jgi:hypothetical protein